MIVTVSMLGSIGLCSSSTVPINYQMPSVRYSKRVKT